MLYGSETWSLGQNEIVISQRTEGAMVRSTCGVALNDKKSAKDVVQMLDLNETMDQPASADSVRWYGQVLTKGKNNFMRGALHFRQGKGVEQRKPD